MRGHEVGLTSSPKLGSGEVRESFRAVGPKGFFQMAQKRHSVDQIISKLRRADVELGKGKKVPEVCKLIEIKEQTYYRWRQKYGSMQPNMAKQFKALQKENARLKKMVAEQGSRYGDFERSHEGKLVSPERRRRTIAEVRRRLGQRKCRSVGRAVCSINLVVRSDTNRAGRMMNPSCFVRCVV